MKALFLAVGLIVGLSVSAQDRAPMLERLQTTLDLSAEQMVEVEKIFTEQGKKRRAMAQEAREAGGRSAMRGRMQAMAAETQKALAEVLNEEQMAQYQELMAEMRPGRPGRPGGRASGERPGRRQQQ